MWFVRFRRPYTGFRMPLRADAAPLPPVESTGLPHSRRSRGEALFAEALAARPGSGRADAGRGVPARAAVRWRRTPAARALLAAAAAAAVAAGCASHLARPAPAAAVAGRCGVEPGVCLLGVPAPLDEGGEASGWQCLGLHGGADAVCPLPGRRGRRARSVLRPAAAASPVAGTERPAPRRVAGAEPAVRTPAAAQAAPAGPAAVSPHARAEIAALLAAKARRTPAQRKLGSRLLDLAAGGGRAERMPRRRPPGDEASVVRRELDAPLDREPAALDLPRSREPARVDTPLDRARDLPGDTPLEPERVLVDIRADVGPAVLARIRELGGAVVDSVPRYGAIRAELPLAALEPLAGMDAVLSIRTADEAVTRGQARGFAAATGADPPGSRAAGKQDTSEGDVAHRADEAASLRGRRLGHRHRRAVGRRRQPGGAAGVGRPAGRRDGVLGGGGRRGHGDAGDRA